jgi:RecQ family ATP-dependent DNA helicase
VLSIAPTPETLLGRFGLHTFRPGQREAVQAALEGRDSLVVMPTGAGKSLCYQLPALTGQGLVVVVSPLIALMADQWRSLRAGGVQASMLASGMPEGHNDKALRDIAAGRAQLVLASPERFLSQSFKQALAKRRIGLFVVDEAHCVAEWGHDFRPDYLRLYGVIGKLARPPIMALTATATPRVVKEIARRLGLRDWIHVSSGFDRPNLTFDVLNFQGKAILAQKRKVLLQTLRNEHSRPAIVYCATRKDTDRVAAFISKQGIVTVAYHAGMEPPDRVSAQEAFMDGRAQVVAATNAFGMGVDKADVRTVVHWAVPKSLEAYYQEVGRAGRDGQPAKALLLAARMDLGRLIQINKARPASVMDIERYVKELARGSRGGRVQREPSRDTERMLLSIAQRAGAVRADSTSSGRTYLQLTGRLDFEAADWAVRSTKDQAWDSYHAIEQFISSEECRRKQILDFFGDPRPARPMVRCCDVCEAAPSAPSPPSPLAPPPIDLRSLQILKQWRSEQAQGKPAYIVATNAVLEEVLQRRPQNIQALLEVNGVGRSFCEKYGESLLKLLDGSQAAQPSPQPLQR